MAKFLRSFAIFAIAFLLALTLSFRVVADAPPNTPTTDTPTLEVLGEGFPVVLDGKTIFLIRSGIGSFTPEERARAIERKIEKAANDETLSTDKLTIKKDSLDNSPSIVFGNTVIVSITPQDTQFFDGNQLQLAELIRNTLKQAIDSYREERRPSKLLEDLGYAGIASVILFLFVFTIISLSGRIFPLIQRLVAAFIPGLRIQNYELISPEKIGLFVVKILQLIRAVFIFTLFFVYLSFVLRLFPWTRRVGNDFYQYFFGSLEIALDAIANYLPNIFIILIIVFVTYYCIKLLQPLFTALERGNLVIEGFYADWARPTYNILQFLIIALATVVAFPYLPGFQSPAFQGVSVFLGVLFSLGSSSAIANVIGGVILIYTRAFQKGDRISIGDVTGDVIQKNLLVTRIRTPTNKIITIPNSSLLNTNVINSSVSHREFGRPAILQTTITLGYDLPWRKVHAVLIEAARATKSILQQPAPFVLQKGLDDFTVNYQLNVYIDRPDLELLIYSELHENIQDKCNEAGIEILSPRFFALRDGNHSTIPENYLPPDYQAPGFNINTDGFQEINNQK